MPYARIRGISLYYEESGAGPHLIVAHGLAGCVSAHASSAADLAACGLHAVSYDARGHGRSGSTKTLDDYHYSALALDMLGLMDALGIARASICGNSMGAGTALMLALLHPDRVERLILRNPPSEARSKSKTRTIRFGALMYQGLGVSLTSRIATLAGGHRMRESLRGQRRDAIATAIRGFLSGSPIPVDRLGEIKLPVLIMTEPGDLLHPVRSAEVMRERIPHAQFVQAPSPDHWHEHPETLTRLIASFALGSTRDVSVH